MANGRKDFYGLPVGPGTLCTLEEGKTVQQEVDSADINKILKRAGITDPSQIVAPQSLFLDTTEFEEYLAMRNRVANAEAYFSSLPAEIRSKFANDPLVFLDEANTEAGVQKFLDLGIIDREAAQPPPPPPPSPPV